ncbi:MAG: 16S rRNA (cytosine(1402)-N(4))-methyltransferase, partial [Actinobacteria bacterium]|nr:16S rRNA (cytosine(1402)-N(4))-methyltransferase [Actinomycetota bacterium]
MQKNISDLHEPVLLERAIELLAPAFEVENPIFVDCTLGLAGHSEAFLEKFPNLTLIGIDRDESALAIAGQRLARFGDRVHLIHAVYDQIEIVLEELGITQVHGILLDLGVSSMQLDQRERGFAYSYDAPLDMRMDSTSGQTAADVL